MEGGGARTGPTVELPGGLGGRPVGERKKQSISLFQSP